jgi:hypothetical protein
MIERFALDSRSHVVEVASNDGYLLQYFKQRRIRVTGIEPAANCAEASRAKGIPTEVLFFSTCTACDLAGRHGRADLIAATTTSARPDFNDITGGIRELLKPEEWQLLNFRT